MQKKERAPVRSDGLQPDGGRIKFFKMTGKFAELAERMRASSTGKRGVHILFLLCLAWLLLASLPTLPFQITTGVDAAWYYALSLIHKQGGRFGPDVTYTAGPLGYLMTPDPELID